MHFSLYLYLFLHLIASALTYSIPDPTVQLINPNGVRISIPHENGIVLVAFHVNIDKPIALNQPGEYSADITEPINGRWIFDNTQTSVDSNSKINYWLHVQYGSYAYRKLGGRTPLEASVDITDPIDATTDNPKSGCELSTTTVNRIAVCKGQLIFEDNFNSLNLTVWQRDVKMPMDTDDAEFVSYQNRDENCYINSGQLHIVPNLLSQVPGFSESSIRAGKLDLGAQCTGINDRSIECTREAARSRILPPVVSARIHTKDFFSFRFGVVEVRAKLPKGDWLFPLILLEPQDNYYGTVGYKSGQMRIAFIRGNEILEDRDGNDISGSRIAGGVVLATKEALRDIWLRGSIRRSHLGDDFHTYTLTWTKDFISLEIDGNEYANFRGNFARLYRTHNLEHAKPWERGDIMAPFDKEFFLTLGVSAGGHSDFPDGCHNGVDRKEKPWTNENPKAELDFWKDNANWHATWDGINAGLHVDYVRVYAL